jgi:cbb3-type cytochrome oxidase cytochrome c subunit
MIHMNPKVVGIGTTILVALIFGAVVVAPRYTNPESNVYSDNHRKRTPLEEEGRELYMNLGCQYCHTQYIRTNDWGLGAERIAKAGDYTGEKAPPLGSTRTGPASVSMVSSAECAPDGGAVAQAPR